RFLADEAFLATVPQVGLNLLAFHAVMCAVFGLPGNIELLRADVLQSAHDVLASVTVEQRNRLVAELGVRQVPVAGRPDVGPGGAFVAVRLDPRGVRFGGDADGVLLAVVVAGAFQTEQPAVLPGFHPLVLVRVNSDEAYFVLHISLAGHHRDAVVLTVDAQDIAPCWLVINLDVELAYFIVRRRRSGQTGPEQGESGQQQAAGGERSHTARG